MKRIVAVLNLGNCLIPKCRASIRGAAGRWDAEYVELTEPIVPGRHHFWQKVLVHKVLPDDAHVLQLDTDMLVRLDCPSPFPLCSPDRIGLTRVNPHFGPWVGGRRQAIDHWAKRLDLPPIDVFTEYPNLGFMLYSTPHHRTLLEEVYAAGEQCNWHKERMPEQTVLAYMCRYKGWRVEWMPTIFNTCGVHHHWQTSLAGPMSTFIYHFCGDAKWVLPKMDWRKPGPQFQRAREIVKRLPEGPCSTTEVGVAWGRMSSRLLAYRHDMHLTMVDWWREVGKNHRYRKSGDALALRNQRLHNQDLVEAWRETEFAIDRRRIIFCDSVDAASKVDDASQDLVFIDGDHSEEGCQRDINAWLPKVKPGGWIGGHDYDRGTKWGVRTAVDATAKRLGWSVEFGGDSTWFVRLG